MDRDVTINTLLHGHIHAATSCTLVGEEESGSSSAPSVCPSRPLFMPGPAVAALPT